MTEFIRHPEQPFETNLSLTDDLFVKWHRVPKKGTYLPQHAHTFAHVSVVAYGGVAIYVDGVTKGTYEAPASIVIEANRKHMFVTTEDNTVILCVHNTSRGEIDISEEHHLVRD